MDQIQCLDVSKSYSRSGKTRFLNPWASWRKSSEEDRFWALKGIDLTISRPGKRVGIIGANGSGKTTLLRILAGITSPTQGTVAVKGRVLPLLEPWTGMQPELTGRENIYLNGIILGMRRAEIRRKFDSIVEFAEVSRFLDLPLKRYSAGMVMRLGFSVAVHVDAEILLVDEIWGAGDAEFQLKSFNEIRRMQAGGMTTLIVSHDLEIIRQLTDETMWLRDGRIAALGPTDSVLEAYQLAADLGLPTLCT